MVQTRSGSAPATELWKFTPPRVDVVNAIGCGLSDGWTGGRAGPRLSLPEAVKYGIAAAGRMRSNWLPSRLDPSGWSRSPNKFVTSVWREPTVVDSLVFVGFTSMHRLRAQICVICEICG